MTDILAWLNPSRWLMLAAVAASLVLGYTLWVDHQQGIGEARANARWQTATDQLKKDATAKLAIELANVRAAEQALQDFKNNQELKDAHHQKTVADIAGRLRAAAGPTGRLRDPNAPGCGGGGGGAQGQVAAATGDSAGDGAEAGGLLSAELSGLLFERLKEADAINIAYASCRPDGESLRALLSP